MAKWHVGFTYLSSHDANRIHNAIVVEAASAEAATPLLHQSQWEHAAPIVTSVQPASASTPVDELRSWVSRVSDDDVASALAELESAEDA